MFSEHLLQTYPVSHVQSIDASARMVNIANTRIKAAAAAAAAGAGMAKGDVVCEVRQATIQALQFPVEGSVDIVVSGLCMHYLDDGDFLTALQQIQSALAPGGLFVMSQEHPLRLANKRSPPSSVRDVQIRRDGWVIVPESARAREKELEEREQEEDANARQETKRKQKKIGFVVDHYLEEGPRCVRWMGGVRVLKYHRSISSIVNAYLGSGFVLRLLDECKTSSSSEGTDSERTCVAHYNRRPLFLVVGAVKMCSGEELVGHSSTTVAGYASSTR